jgi:PAS domain-containing protein
MELVFYNPAAEPIIGRPFAELGEIQLREWYGAFQATSEDGSPIQPRDHPLYRAVNDQKPSKARFVLHSLDGIEREIEGTAFPLEDHNGRNVGAVGIFWEVEEL